MVFLWHRWGMNVRIVGVCVCLLVGILGCSGLQAPPAPPTEPVVPFDAWAWWQGLSPCVQEALLGDKPKPTDASGVEPLLTASQLVIYPNCKHPLSDLEWIRPLSSLTSLSIRSQPITDLTPLQSAPLLRELTFENWKLSEWPASLTLPQLESLTLHAQLPDLGFLSRHNAIRELRLEGMKAEDLSPLQALPLEKLSLSGKMKITELSALSGKETLRELSVYNTRLTSIEALSTVKGLEILNLTGEYPASGAPLDLRPLGKLPLRELRLESYNVSGVEVIGQVHTLKELGLVDISLSSLDPIAPLSLSSLDLTDTSSISEEQIAAYQAAHPGVSVASGPRGD